ncbi:MAG: amidohydrolase [Bryobacterales bacterium]|nr:amidohydrolase [Bryobacterales bacterium]
MGNAKLSPDQIREAVRKNKADGTDVIKMFAWTGTLIGGGQRTLSNEQITAGCGEAKAQGLRSVVHVYGDEAIRAVAEAGCTGVEHGFFASDETLRILARLGTYYDPHIGLVMQNYLNNRPKFLGIGSYKEEEMAAMKHTFPSFSPLSLAKPSDRTISRRFTPLAVIFSTADRHAFFQSFSALGQTLNKRFEFRAGCHSHSDWPAVLQIAGHGILGVSSVCASAKVRNNVFDRVGFYTY